MIPGPGTKILHVAWPKKKKKNKQKNRSVVAWAEMVGEVGINWLTREGHKKTFKINGNVLYLDYGDGISISQNSSSCTIKMGTFYCM